MSDLQVEKCRNDCADCRMKASEICDPIETKRSVHSIENEITQIQRRIEEEEEKQGNEIEITETYRSKKEKLEIVKREVGQLKNYIERLTDVRVVLCFSCFCLNLLSSADTFMYFYTI